MKKKKFRTKKFLSHLKSASTKFYEKQNNLGLGLKLPYFGTFRPEFEKNYCHIWNQHLGICENENFHAKGQKIKFRTKNASLWYFRKKLLSYLT